MSPASFEELMAFVAEAPPAQPIQELCVGLDRWDRRLPVLVAVAMGEASLRTWERGLPSDSEWPRQFAESPLPREAIVAAHRYLADGTRPQAQLMEALDELIRVAYLNAEELSGDAETVAARRQYCSSEMPINCAVRAANWTEEEALRGIQDEPERRAVPNMEPQGKLGPRFAPT